MTKKQRFSGNCSKCNKLFDRQVSLTRHENNCQPKEEKCQYCDKSFRNNSTLRTHNYRYHQKQIQDLKLMRKFVKTVPKKAIKKKPPIKKQPKIITPQQRTHNNCVYSIDIEDSGLIKHSYKNTKYETKEIIEMAICSMDLKTQECKIIYHKKFKPIHEISAETTRIHGYTAKSLKKEQPFTPESAQELIDILKQCKVMIAHQLESDLQTLQLQFKQIDCGYKLLELPAETVCTWKYAQYCLFGELKLHTLARKLIPEFPLHQYKTHRADHDALICAHLYHPIVMYHNYKVEENKKEYQKKNQKKGKAMNIEELNLGLQDKL